MFDVGVTSLLTFFGHVESMVASPASCCTPARPSSAALKPAFNIRRAIGDSVSICRHQATVSRSRSSRGTTVLTRPHSRAWAASYWRQRNHTSFARLTPMVRASSDEPYPPSNEPTADRSGRSARCRRPTRGRTPGARCAAPDGISGHLGDHGLGETANLNLKIKHVEAPHATVGDVVITDISVVATNALVAAGAERVVARAGQHHDPYRQVVARLFEGSREFKECLGAKGVSHLGRLIVMRAIPSATS